jgi:hypothetical protein
MQFLTVFIAAASFPEAISSDAILQQAKLIPDCENVTNVKYTVMVRA